MLRIKLQGDAQFIILDGFVFGQVEEWGGCCTKEIEVIVLRLEW